MSYTITERPMSDGDYGWTGNPGSDADEKHNPENYDPYPYGLECLLCGGPIHEHDDGECVQNLMDQALADYDPDMDIR